MAERSSIFDMLGPVMIGPSSSHTAGVVRLGRVARHLLGGAAPAAAEVTFYNSFAATYEGHGSDRAVLGGLLDFAPDDVRIREAEAEATRAGLAWTFKAAMAAGKLHPNSIRIGVRAADGTEADMLGISRGGGLITVVEVDGLHTNFTAQLHGLLIDAEDRTGSIAYIAGIMANEGVNIATMTVARRAKSDLAKLVLEMDGPLRALSLEYLKSLAWVRRVVALPVLA